MPRSVIVVSDDPSLFQSVASVLVPDGRLVVVGDELVSAGSAAPSTTICPVEVHADEWEGWRPGESGLTNPGQMSSLVFETRSPAWVAEVGLLLAHGLRARAWFVDAADIAWPVGDVDPHRIALG